MSSKRRTIVVGSGSGGGVVASRLSEDQIHEVVLIEAGPFYSSPDQFPADLLDAANPSFEDHDWGYSSRYLEPVERRAPVPYPRGRVVGGSSSVNASIGQRGHVEDFEAWAGAGNTDWSWDQVLPYYRKLERDLDFGSDPAHGSDGPVPIMRFPRENWAPAILAIEEASLDAGLPACPDANAPGSIGVGPVPRNQDGDLRASTMLTYLQPAAARENLEIRDQTLARRVVLDGNRAVGVEIETAAGPEILEADDVVLSAGVFGTPQLLMLSGIGPRVELQRVGIDAVVTLDGVGRALKDHPFVPLIAIVSDRNETRDGMRAELRFSSSEGENDLASFPGLLQLDSLNFEVETDARAALLVPGLVSKPASEGWVGLLSDDPTDEPDIHMNFMSDRRDMTRMMEAVRFCSEIVNSKKVEGLIDGVLFPDAETIESAEALESFISENVTSGFHGACTCRMGPASDPTAVVDQRLAVHGTENLYVADASIMPDITSCFTNLTCYMIGERLADWLRQEAGSPARQEVAS